MRLRLVLPLLCLLPFAAVGQSVDAQNAQAQYLLAQPTSSLDTPQSGHVMPFWQDASGHVLAIESDSSPISDRYGQGASLAGYAADPGSLATTGLRYGIGPNLQAHAELSQQSWINSPYRVLGSEVGASYDSGRYSVGVSVGTSTTPDNNPLLPRVLPGTAPGVDGLSAFDSSAQFKARGRLALGNRNGIDLSASVGRIHLLPGNLLGVSTLDQKALSFGVEHGALSGVLVGRTMQPEAGIPGELNTDNRRWNSIDLGVTWRLPWSGSLSVGAQNLWSSGTPANTPAGPEPDQSRTPYVQYHQDL
jgi:hypothetical protein